MVFAKRRRKGTLGNLLEALVENLAAPSSVETEDDPLSGYHMTTRGNISFQVAGENYRGESTADLGAGFYDALLAAEPTNSYDRNAVMVFLVTPVEGNPELRHVGYLQRRDAKNLSRYTQQRGVVLGRCRLDDDGEVLFFFNPDEVISDYTRIQKVGQKKPKGRGFSEMDIELVVNLDGFEDEEE